MEKRPKIEIYKDEKGEYRWRLKAPNGRIIADSAEGYKTKTGCMLAVENLQIYSVKAFVIDLTKKKKRRRKRVV